MTFVRFYPRNLDALTSDAERMFNRFFDTDVRVDKPEEAVTWTPRVDIFETEDAFQLHLEVPGMKKTDFNIEFENEVLTVSGERKREDAVEGANYLMAERSHGTFSRAFRVQTPIDANKIDATYKNGILSIVLPKAEEAKPRKIDVKITK